MSQVKIPKLISARWHADFSFLYLPRTLERWEKDQKEMGYEFILCPDYQRGHVWTVEQQISYVEWMLQGGQTGRTLIFNHPGWHSDYRGNMECVDGLQRITATYAFLNGEIPAFGHYRDDFKEVQLRGQASNFTIWVGNYDRETVLKWYLQMNGGGTPHAQYELNRVKTLLKQEQFRKVVDDVNDSLFA